MSQSAFVISMLAVVAALGCGGRERGAGAGAASGGGSSLGGASTGAASGGGSSPGGAESGIGCAPAYGSSWGFASPDMGFGPAASDRQGNVAYMVDRTGTVDLQGNLANVLDHTTGIASRDAKGTLRWAQPSPWDGGAPLGAPPIAPTADGGSFGATVSAVAPVGDGGFFVAGEMTSSEGSTSFVSRLNSQGAITWTQPLSANSGRPSFLAFDGSDRLWVLGFSGAPSTDPNRPTTTFASLALLGSDGRFVWQERFGDAQSFSFPLGLALTMDGHAVIALRAGGSLSIADPQADATANHGLLASFDADGTHAWSRAVGQLQQEITSLAVAANGTLYATGWNLPSAPGSTTAADPFLIALSGDGTVRWRRTYSLGIAALDPKPMVAARPCGGLVIAAQNLTYMNNHDIPETLLIDVDDSGQEQRVRHVANASARIVAHGSDGIVLVGQFFGNLTFDSVQLSATGVQGSAFVARFLE